MSALARLLEQATPGPWEPHDQGGEINIGTMAEWVASVDTSYDVPFDRAQCEADARLIALAPDMASLLIDMAAWVDEILTKPYRVEERWNAGNALLARFAELEQRAAP